MLYMDEIFGYFPPVANPPSKAPLLTLLKQARASGLGVVLATQNPVDLDYKGLSNTGTWFSAGCRPSATRRGCSTAWRAPAEGGAIDAPRCERLLSSLSGRVFLMRNVHEDA